MRKDVIVIGAGASGLICAGEAGKRGRSVLVVDHAPKTGSKIRISGGGKCNVTNLYMSEDNYISRNPHFCKSALSRFTPNDVISLLKKHKISLHEKESGHLFCDTSASSVVKLLEAECRNTGVEIRLNCPVVEIRKDREFVITTKNGLYHAHSLVIATGGKAPDEISAITVQKVLESEGIRAWIQSIQVPWYDGIMKMVEGYWGKVMVFEDQEEEARRVIEDFFRNLGPGLH